MTSDNYEFTITRIVSAPTDVVWKAWSEEAQLAKWFSPKGFTVVRNSLDFQVGGQYLYGLDSGFGITLWGKWQYQEIVYNEKIVAIASFTDETGTVLMPHPLQSDWPLQVLSTVSFVDKGMNTEICVVWQALDENEQVQQAFQNSEAAMQIGWTGTFDLLSDYLEQVNNAALNGSGSSTTSR